LVEFFSCEHLIKNVAGAEDIAVLVITIVVFLRHVDLRRSIYGCAAFSGEIESH
jgi:hypothetical protein